MPTAQPRTLTRYKADLFHQKGGLCALCVIATDDVAQFLGAELARFSFKTFKPKSEECTIDGIEQQSSCLQSVPQC